MTAGPRAPGRGIRLPSDRALLATLALVLTAGAVLAHRWGGAALAFDGDGYYAYLPAWLVEHDPSLRTIVAEHFAGHGSGIFFPQSTGGYLDKYPVGTAVLILPFFLAGEAGSVVAGLNSGGYGTASQIAISLSMIAFTLAGVWALHRVLIRRFSRWATLATIGCAVFGTDLFHYTTYEPGFSHAYTFALVSALLLATLRWYDHDASFARAAAVGALAGLIFIVRPSNVVLLFVIPLVGITSVRAAGERARLLVARAAQVGVMAGTAAAFLVPQLVLWHIATGRWVVFSYADNHEYFELTHPHVLQVLFSFGPHGLLPWEPVLALAILGLLALPGRAPEWVLPLAVVLPLNLWIVSGWYEWYYGGGFGLRPFIDSIPLMAIPLAALLDTAARLRLRTAVAAVASLCVALTMTMMVHYWRHEVAPDGISAGDYVRVLLST